MRSGLICAGCLWFAEAATHPGGIIDRFILLQIIVVSLGLVLVADYAIVAAATYLRSRDSKQGASRKRGGIWPWVPIPLALSLAFLAGMTDRVNTWRFEVSRPALEQAAIDTLQGKPPQTPCWIGLYQIQRAGAMERRVGLKTGMSGELPIGFHCEWPRSLPLNALSQVKPKWSIRTW